jgi:hypothetical protein
MSARAQLQVPSLLVGRAGVLRKSGCQDLDQGDGIPPGAEVTAGQAAWACRLAFEQW